MLLAKVTGALVSTQKIDSMRGRTLLVVDPQRLDRDGVRLVPTGRALVAVDTVGAGEGEMVLITQGSSARLTPETKSLPIDTVIIGIVDTVHVGAHCAYSKEARRAPEGAREPERS